MRDDLKTALRSLRSSRGCTITSLIVLALGIGATTAFFSVADAVVLRGLPFDQQERLVAVGEGWRGPGRAGGRSPASLGIVAPQNYLDWAAQQRVFESIGAMASGSRLTLREPGTAAESVDSLRVTAGVFDVLRARPLLGHLFTKDNEVRGRDRVAVLADGLWRRRFGSDPRVVGRLIALDDLRTEPNASGDNRYEIVGVMADGFAYPVGSRRPADLWVPYVVSEDDRVRDPGRRSNYLEVIARLRPGVSLAQAQAQMNQVSTAIERANPSWNKDNAVGVQPLVDHVVGAGVRSWMLMLLGAVAVVLIIACANVANLLLARAGTRGRELAIRAALGATRFRLVRQLMTEGLLLSVAGTACAIVPSWWAIHALRASMPQTLPRIAAIGMDLRVLMAAATLSLVTGVLVGALPALHLSRPDDWNTLRGGVRTGRASARPGVRNALVIAEMASAVVLLIGTGLFIRSFVSLIRIDPGFDSRNVLTAEVFSRVQPRAQSPGAGPAFEEIAERIGHLPGIIRAAVSTDLPLSGGVSSTSIVIPGTAVDLRSGNMIAVHRVTPDYHEALGIPLRKGRLFSRADVKGSPGVVLVNELAARKYFGNDDPLGRTVRLNGERIIVGVVGNVHHLSLESEPQPEAYLPVAQGGIYSGAVVVRTAGNPYDALPAVRSVVSAVLPDVPLRNVATMDERVARQLALREFTMWIVGLFGILALVIAAVGVYGVMASLVGQRTREIGVRMALGATPGGVMRLVLANVCALIAASLALGAIAAWYLSAAAKAFLFRVEPTDARAFVVALTTLTVAALVASIVPIRRAARIDPIAALRCE